MYTIRPLAIVAAGTLLLSASVAFADDTILLPSAVRPQNAAREMTRVNVQDVRPAIPAVPAPRAELRNVLKSVQESFQDQAKTLRQDTTVKLKEATSSALRRDVLKDAISERKDLVQERRATTTAMKLRLSLVVRQHVGEIARRFSVALLQFDNLTTRIQTRIDKLKGAGIDANATDALFASAQSAVLQAKADVQAVRDLVAQVTDASDPKTVKESVDAAVKKATASIRTAHDALVKTAVSLEKTARPQRQSPQATSTQQNIDQ